MSSNVVVVADIGNLYHRINQKFKRKLNYDQLVLCASGSGQLYRLLAYGTQAYDEAAPFITYLKNLGFDVKIKKQKLMTARGCEEQPQNWNVGIAMDVVRLIGRTDTLILCSSHPDLIPLVHWVRDQGVRVIVCACSIPQALREAADDFIEIGEAMLETC